MISPNSRDHCSYTRCLVSTWVIWDLNIKAGGINGVSQNQLLLQIKRFYHFEGTRFWTLTKFSCCFNPCVPLVLSWLSTDRADWSWSGTAAATASIPRSPVTAGFPRALQSSCVPPQPPPWRSGWHERPAPCQESAASLPTGPAIGRRAAEDCGTSRAPVCRSRCACGNRPSRSPGKSLVWSKRLSTLSYLRRREWNCSIRNLLQAKSCD